jgi:hypothetical protein
VHYTVEQTRDTLTRYLTLRYTELNVDQSLSILLTGNITTDMLTGNITTDRHFFVR